MKRSVRMTLLGAGAFLLFVVLSVSIQRWIVYPQFELLEKQDLQRSTDALLAAYDREAHSLGEFIADYAEWDDTWAFVADNNPVFLKSNFAAASFQRGNFHCVWILAADGRVLYRAAYNFEQDTLEEITAEAGERILEGHPFLQPLTGQSMRGLLPLAGGITMVAAHPILTTKGEGPPRGILIMGRYLGPAFAEKLSEQVQRPVQVGNLQDWFGRVQEGQPLHRHLRTGELQSVVLWNDLFGKSGLVLTMISPPDVTTVGKHALVQSVAAVVAQGVLFVIIGGMLARRSLRRSQQEEITRQLAERTAALQETEQYLKTIMENVPAGIVIVDAASHRIVDANPAALHLMAARREDVLGNVCRACSVPGNPNPEPGTVESEIFARAERIMHRLDGSQIPVIKTVVPIRLRGQDCQLHCFVDIRDQKDAEEKMRQTVEDLGRLNRAMLGREERVLELKSEVNQLLKEVGRATRYSTQQSRDTKEGA
jgi:PAS domain S-box-containing protein